MEITIGSEVVEAMRAAAGKAYPHEACGILLGQGNHISRFRQAANVHEWPATHFEIDPQSLIDAHRAQREGGLEVLGYFHSHPDGSPRPSRTDQQMASGEGRIWAILGGSELTFSRDNPEGFQPLCCRIIDS